MSSTCETISEQRCFGGVQGIYQHHSAALGRMRFSVFMPPATGRLPPPVIYYLAGLTCTEETFVVKAGAQRMAAELGLCLVTCDTSPREVRYPGDEASWDFGVGAGFYLDATQDPWRASYRMETYVTAELRTLIEASFAVSSLKRGIFGHSMGGHGALTLALRNPELYQSVSAFAPIVAPSQVPWGQKAFRDYLGVNSADWAAYDATELVQKNQLPFELLIDQGLADKFLERELRPDLFEAACTRVGQKLRLRRHAGFDHSYFFILTFVEDHLRHHAKLLGCEP
jgi:S-formylglutathione hydrolase